MANIGLPKLDIVFKGLGVSAIQRGEKGVAVLIIRDDTDTSPDFQTYRTLADITEIEEKKYTKLNLQFIKDTLEGLPSKLIVIKYPLYIDHPDGEFSLSLALSTISDLLPRNCWIGIVDFSQKDYEILVTWIKNENNINKKAYKGIVFALDNPDSKYIVNLENMFVVFNDERGFQIGNTAIPYLLGFFAGLPLTMSGIAIGLNKFKNVMRASTIISRADSVNSGKLVLYVEDNKVKIARAINSLVTTGQNITDDMKFILVVESMHLIYGDIYETWNNHYKGKYKNLLDNQLLLIGAINSYFEGLENDLILDPNFENKVYIDIGAQRRANVPKFGEEIVSSWNDKKAMTMTVGTQVFLKANIKILNTFEDIVFNIYL